jgi:hypothetical protein
MIDHLTSEVLSRHSEDYQDPGFWSAFYPRHLEELEEHEAMCDREIDHIFATLCEHVKKYGRHELNQPYTGKYLMYYAGKTNLEAIRASAHVNRQGHSFTATSVLRGYNTLLENLP